MKKNVIFILTLLFWFSSQIQGQSNYKPQSECENHNQFLRSDNYEELKELSDTIFPSGIIYLNPSKVKEVGQEGVMDLLGLENETTFELIQTNQSRFNEQKIHRRYQQYYQGIFVDGGGYSITSHITGGGNPIGAPDPTWDGPCEDVSMAAFYVLSDIDLSTTPQINEEEVKQILNVTTIEKEELIISHNILNDCKYLLTWKVNYYDNNIPKKAWIDAQNGNILKNIDAIQRINAPTQIYGTQNLNDNTVGGTTSLETSDGSVVAYDFTGFNVAGFPNCATRNPVDFQSNLTPTTTNNQWAATDAPEAVYQGFFVTNLVKDYFDDININFNTINVGINCLEANAFSHPNSTLQNAFIIIGSDGNNSFSVFDVIGHELGHTYLNAFLNYDAAGNASLHEGIADMIGTYTEYRYQGTVDWIMGDDVAALQNLVNRDLENPEFDCFTDASSLGFDDRHRRSTALGHWFFLIAEGFPGDNIPWLGIEKSLDIVLEALNSIGVNSDYADLMSATLTVAEQNFGRCSNEFLAVARAWEEICLTTGYTNSHGEVPRCNYSVSGPSWVCEEDDFASFCVQGGLPNAHYTWTIIGGKSTQYTSSLGMQGNMQNGGHCLTLTDFPKYDWYPQTITIKVYSPTVGSSYIVRKTVRLVDCNGDDPTCEEFYSSPAPLNENEVNSERKREKIGEIKYIKVYNVSGRLIYSELASNFDKNTLSSNQLYFIVYTGEKGEIINTEKYFRIGN